jgi:hypothetical protein
MTELAATKDIQVNAMISTLNNPEEHYPDNFDTPQRANALLTGLCQDAATKLEQMQLALDAWFDKTEWVQETAQPLELGMHRADVLKQRVEHLARSNAALVVALEDLMEATGRPPERNCSCHISPPCPDCIDYWDWREALENADSARALAKATEDQAGPTTGRTSCNTPVFQNLPLNTPEASALKQAMLAAAQPAVQEIEYCNDYHCAGDCGQPHNQEEMQDLLKAQPDYAWTTIEDYEKEVGFKVNDAFKAAWTMARTTNDLFKQMGEST